MSELTSVRRELPEFPKILALAVRYALDHLDRIAQKSMRSSAAVVGVASPSMLLLARRAGFSRCDALRASIQSKPLGTGFGTRAGASPNDVPFGGSDTLARRGFEAAGQNIRQAVARRMRQAPGGNLVGSGLLFRVAAMTKNTGNMILPDIRLIGSECAVAAEALGEPGHRNVVLGFGISPCVTRTSTQ